MKVDSGKALWTIIWMVGAAVVAVVVLGEVGANDTIS